MKLRDHPLMSYYATRNWPPVWIEKFAQNKTLKGEIGVQELFDDPSFCALIGNLLRAHINKSIEEIDSLDLSQTL